MFAVHPKVSGALTFVVLLSFVATINTRDLKSQKEIIQNLNFETHETKTASQIPSPRYRLPVEIVPTAYKLEILPILDVIPGRQRFTAPGKVWISVNSTESTSAIVLHASGLTINDTSVKVRNIGSNTEEIIARMEYDPTQHFYSIHLQNPTTALGMYEVYIEYIAPISRTDLNGMYLDFYVDSETGETSYIATTTFAAIEARRAFPCFDEPNLKATFEITLGRHVKYHSLSNAHLVSTQPIQNVPGLENWYWDNFAVTVPMSTYLVCMIVSTLDYVETPVNGNDTRIRVYGEPYLIARGGGNYSANLTKNVLAVFEEYYDLKYSLEKLYSVALPQFHFSAMENWGLITYTEDALIYLIGETTEPGRYRITNVVAHEVSHQFFGNYVTCKFWTWVWLNEGFATYVSHLGVEMTYPEFTPWQQFIVNVYQNALQHDAGRSTHPVENEPLTMEAIGGIYDRIAYDKGACLIRMMEGFLTEPVLQAGIRIYLKEMALKGAEQDDLFRSLQEAADTAGVITGNASVKEIMDTWTKQAGFPLLRVSVVSSSQLQITQEVFIGDGIVNPNATWWIPVTITHGTNADSHWIPSNEKQISIAMNTEQVFVVNPGSVGYYRILYSGLLSEKIKDQLHENHEVFSPETRAKILDDYLNLAINNYITQEAALDMTEYMERETELIVWNTVLKNYKNVTSLNEFNANSKKYSLGPKIENVLATIGLQKTNQDSTNTVMLRSILLQEACAQGANICKTFSELMTTLWKINPHKNPIPVDIQEVLSCQISNSNASEVLTLEGTNVMQVLTTIIKIELEDYSISCTSKIPKLQPIHKFNKFNY